MPGKWVDGARHSLSLCCVWYVAPELEVGILALPPEAHSLYKMRAGRVLNRTHRAVMEEALCCR